jgi:hypothetical protein
VSHRHICVHGHFYQPPRENPWTGAVDREASAGPFHDWNARIAEECYGPITLGVRGGSDGTAIAYDETLKRLSYDFGPTLLSWLERERPSILRRVLAADAATQTAIAQPYYHNILPLESRRDKATLVRWGMAEFKKRFGRVSKGMWLPETAVDIETLEVLAAEGVEFTILDPKQGEAVRDLGSDEWVKLDAEHVDPKMPYLWTSPKDPSKKLVIFFYHHRLSFGVVTGETVASVEHFADAARARLMPGDAAQLVHVASDGEFYGHHHPGAERVLTLTLDLLEADGIPAIDPARFLALFPPPHEVRIKENTAWSCEHGLGRWERDCGCRSAHLADWSQDWRAGMRDALKKLAARLDAFYEDDASLFFTDPWKARDESIALWFAHGDEAAAAAFFKANAKRPLSPEEEKRALELLLMQRERLAMFTSCGWFFDDISGVEAVLCLTKAARALDIAKLLGENAEAGFVERLAACRSNLPRLENGAKVWRTLVAASRVSLERAAAHAALLDHLELPAPAPRLLSWKAGPAFRSTKSGLAGRERSLSIRPVAASRLETRETAEFHVVVHRADRLDFACWLAPRRDVVDPGAIGDQFLRLPDDEFRAAMDERFGPAAFGLDAALNDDRGELIKALASAGALGASRAAFLKTWVECISALRAGGKEDDVMLQLLSETGVHAFNAQELPWISELEDRLHARMEAVVASPLDGALVSRALRWLDALWDAGLLSGVWRLRDEQRRWAAALEGTGPSAALDACRAVGERLGLARISTEAAS